MKWRDLSLLRTNRLNWGMTCGERERGREEEKLFFVLENELGSRRFLLLRSFQIKIVNSKGEFTWIRWMKWKLEKG